MEGGCVGKGVGWNSSNLLGLCKFCAVILYYDYKTCSCIQFGLDLSVNSTTHLVSSSPTLLKSQLRRRRGGLEGRPYYIN